MELARRMVQGVDVWLNTPTRPLEASGTSGEKALMNGVLNFSVLDGWWYEGYRKDAGWALTDKSTYQNEQYQNQLDAEAIYYLLEHDILPLYYEHGGKNYSENWVKYIKNSIAQIAPHFTMKRQLDDYYDRFYNKLSEHFHILAADNFAKAKMMADWKANVRSRWDAIEIKSIEAGNGLNATVEAGKEYEVTVVVDEKGLDDAIGIESVIIRHEGGQDHIYEVIPLSSVSKNGNLYTFKATSGIFNAGSFKQAFRMYPKNALLPHRQDFCYVRWF
jgi:starch phosphorylase